MDNQSPHITDMYLEYATHPVHGGKITCHKCNGFICISELFAYHRKVENADTVYFHKECFNRYEHYYGLDRPID